MGAAPRTPRSPSPAGGSGGERRQPPGAKRCLIYTVNRSGSKGPLLCRGAGSEASSNSVLMIWPPMCDRMMLLQDHGAAKKTLHFEAGHNWAA